MLNTWEAVYFDQSLERLEPLIDAAARVGVERFVLDDGWFHGRRDDRRALGDWTVDSGNWPDGLAPLIARVHEAGMDFGLWVEPEMVNLDSDLARAHPEWMLGRPGDLAWRHQHVLDLTAPGAADHVFARLDELLSKQRDRLPQVGPQPRPARRIGARADPRRPTRSSTAFAPRIPASRSNRAPRAARASTSASSSAPTGVWPSDTNDPLERQGIHRYTSLVVPPEYLGAHLGATRAHTTGRTAELSFRFATALFGSAGIEWNLADASDAELDHVAAWAREYRRLRPLLHTGTVVRPEPEDPAQVVHGVVSPDRTHAIFSVAMLGTARAALPPAVRIPGLDADRTYRVRRLEIGPAPRTVQDAASPVARGGNDRAHRAGARRGRPRRAAARTRERDAVRAHGGVTLRTSGRAADTWLRVSVPSASDHDLFRALIAAHHALDGRLASVIEEATAATARWEEMIAAELGDPARARLLRLVGDGLAANAVLSPAARPTDEEIDALIASIIGRPASRS